MGLFKKQCELCCVKIEYGKEIVDLVKVPELKGFRKRIFCSVEHAEKYKRHVTGTKRTRFCPSCGV